MHLFYNALEDLDFAMYIKEAESEFAQHDPDAVDGWNHRTVCITDRPVAQRVKSFLEKHLNCTLVLQQAQIQVWPVGHHSGMHRHDYNGRESADFNSLLYLNEDFVGGEFFTGDGLTITPKKGLLTFFDGRKVWHGVNKVQNKNRYTFIFWWTDTKFNYEQVLDPI
jgi:hypothetical protein